MGTVESVLLLLVWLAVVAIIVGVVVWGIKTLLPDAPAVLVNGIVVIGVLLILLLLVRALGGLGPPLVR